MFRLITYFYLIILLVSCNNSNKEALKDSINVLNEDGISLKIDEYIEDFSLKKLQSFSIYNNIGDNYGNIIINNFANKIKKSAKFKDIKVSTNLPFFISPLIIDDKIYILNHQGNIAAYNKNNKQLIWKKSLSKLTDNLNHLKGGINYYKDKLYITIGSNMLFSLNANNGQILWQKKLESLIRSKPYISQDKVYIASLDSKIYAFSYINGKLLWQHDSSEKLSSQYGNSSFIANDLIIASGNSEGSLIILDNKTGKEIWQENISSRDLLIEHFNFYDIDATPVIFDKYIYAASNDGWLTSFDYISGIKTWEKKISAYKTPWVTERLLFIIDNKNRLIAITKESGRIKWFVELDTLIKEKKEDKLFYGPVLVNGKIMVSCNCGVMSAFDYNSGELVKSYNIVKNINHFPIINNNKLYMINNKSVLYEYN
jgi:outer membrane protein assembly factor BamB